MTASPTASDVRSQAPEQLDLRTLLDEVVAAGAPGILARVQTGAKTLSLESGVADLRTGAPMKPQLHFRVASITKSFVATVVLQLVGEGRLGLDDPVDRWLPSLLPQGNAVTVRQLLNHTSGLPDYLTGSLLQLALTGWAFRPEELVAIAVSQPPRFPPGTDWSYSNTNYIVAGLIIEKVTGQPIEEELRARIFHPLKLADTTFPNDVRIPAPHARGYWFFGDIDLTTALHSSVAWAAGAIISTAADLARFYQALLGGRLLHPELLKAMKTTARDASGKDTEFGLGLTRIMIPCGTMWGHFGSIPSGYQSFAASSSDGTKSAVAMVNIFAREPVREPFLAAVSAAVCLALGQPPTAVAIDDVEHLLRLFSDWAPVLDMINTNLTHGS
ncbi:MAG: serine hydrolase domain-containing protein [Egibacteraceae bacterium]